MKPAKTIASQKIGHLEAKALVCDLFTSIQSSKSVGELTSIPSKLKYGQQITTNMPGAKFPRLRFRVSIEEIEFIRQLGVFADHAQFSPILATGEYAHGKKMTPLEKILYAILWKNGDLARIIHQELADVVYLFEISYDFAVEFQNPRIQRPHPP